MFSKIFSTCISTSYACTREIIVERLEKVGAHPSAIVRLHFTFQRITSLLFAFFALSFLADFVTAVVQRRIGQPQRKRFLLESL